ncbi:MAG: hypothetical protein CSA60_02510 [Neptuniibacter caesariensis]|uniref:Glycosyl transferase family 1 domain-containing protein n=1 Tax=Neptuniibacter caesariensis TaxID=207954 RepID=A0A2G6JN59_NEPCE|nr:MAG: hypothetical protein CSA60_02510 [Neptuniibacter caesariensis]
MKILHICLASHYTEGMTYQDNQLPDQNVVDGHDVIVVSDCYKYEGVNLVEVNEEDCITKSGVRLVRMKYDRIINDFISSKIRKVKRLYDFLVTERPDVILFHGVAGFEMLSVAKYKMNNSKIKLYVDSHEDYHNSGTVWVSLFFQYRVFNSFIVSRIRKYVDKFLFLSYETRDFLVDIYGLKNDELEFYPLGGVVINEKEKRCYSDNVRRYHGYESTDILIVHTGKLTASKKTKELIEAFSQVRSTKLKLLIIGSIPEEQKPVLNSLISNDERINFLGWKNADELTEYLCAADIYFQPGTQSATMQNAICCGVPVALYPYSSHEPYLKNNGFFVKNSQDYIDVLNEISSNPQKLLEMSDASYLIAREILDYKVLAARLYR